MCDVDIATGQVERSRTDLYLPGYLPIEFTCIYYSANLDAGFLGPGWRHGWNQRLRYIDGWIYYEDGFGQALKFESDPVTGHLVNTAHGLSLIEVDRNWILQDETGLRQFFPKIAGLVSESRPVRIVDIHQNALDFHYYPGSLTFAISDQLGRFVSFERDMSGLLRTIRAQSAGESKVIETYYEFDRKGRLTSVVDPIGRVTAYEYEANLLTREVRPDGTEIVWKYDDARRCVETWRTGGVLYRRLEFDDRQKRVRVTNSRGYAYVYQLDENGGILGETDPRGDLTETYLDETGEILVSSRNGSGEGYSVVVDDVSNHMKMSLPFGTFVYQFDEHDRLASITSEGGAVWSFEHGPSGETVSEERPGGSRFVAEYAPQGWVRRVTSQSGYYIEQQRTDDRRRIKLSDTYGTLCAMDFDGFGALIRVSDEVHGDIHLNYDKAGRLVRITPANQKPREAVYDCDDNIEQIVTETGRSWRFKFNTNRVLEHVIDPSGARSDFRYDAEQLMVHIRKPNGEEVKVEYDELGRPAILRLPDGTTETYTYNLFSSISSVSLNGRLHRSFSYQDGQIAGIQYADGEQRQFEWSRGLPVGGRYSGHSIERKFDERSRLLEEKSEDSCIALAYDPADNLVRVSDTTGRLINFDYDGRKRVTRIEDSSCGLHQFTYKAGFEISEWRIDGGCIVRFFHDPVGLLKGFVVTGPEGRTVIEHDTTYAADGKVLRESLRTAKEELVAAYRYDAAGRPIEIARSGTGVASYNYDANDNVTFSSELGECSFASGDRFIRGGPISYEYDDFGRVVLKRAGKTSWTYKYNSASELSSVSLADGSTVDFSYDAFGRLCSRFAGGSKTTFNWLEHSMLSEISDDYKREYLFLPTTFFCIAVNDSRVGKAFLCPDRTGSPVCMIGFDGTILWRREFRLLGSLPSRHDRTGNASPVGFLGQYREANSGLDYNYARFYDATTGRYLTQDPLGFAGGMNFYSYAADPLTQVDPFGLFTIALEAPPMWCRWNRQQRQEYRDKVNRYNQYIQQKEKKPGEGLQVTSCARSGKKASQQWESSKCCNRKPPKQKKPKRGKGAAPDCKKDIDHIIDCQLGGDQECPEVCKNLIPVNSSVNQSIGPTMADQLKGKAGQFLEKVTFSPERCKRHAPRTRSCI